MQISYNVNITSVKIYGCTRQTPPLGDDKADYVILDTLKGAMVGRIMLGTPRLHFQPSKKQEETGRITKPHMVLDG